VVPNRKDNGRREMPIRRYVEKGVVFTPQALSVMSKAFEATTERLGIGPDEPKRQAVAKFIIRLAQDDGDIEVAALRDKALAALGGATYCAPPESGQELASAAE
jgi:hypothetical protein